MSAGPGRKRPLLLNCSKFDSTGWKWFEGRLDADFLHVDAYPRNFLERRIRRPALSRYRAALQAAWKSRSVDLLISHAPDITAWTELARRGMGVRNPHLAFSFNFTRLPEGGTSRLMASAFRTVDRFIVFSRMERDLYAATFGIPPERVEMIHWGVRPPVVTALPAGTRPDFISAVGGEGRDYGTFLAAMEKIPHIRAEVVARPHNIGSTRIPSNVTVRTNIPFGEANAIISHSRFLVVPLLHSKVPCGHVTIVSGMQLGKPIVATDSLGISDYVVPGKTALLCKAGDANAMADCIARLWDDTVQVAAMGAAASAFADRYFTEEATVRHVQRLVSQMTS